MTKEIVTDRGWPASTIYTDYSKRSWQAQAAKFDGRKFYEALEAAPRALRDPATGNLVTYPDGSLINWSNNPQHNLAMIVIYSMSQSPQLPETSVDCDQPPVV